MRYEPDTEEADIARVEEMLSAAARNPVPTVAESVAKPVASHALWLCACVSDQIAPTWLIYKAPDDGVGWQRVPDGVEPLDLVDAQRSAGGHVSPSDVRHWLEGEEDPWGLGPAGDIFGDSTVLPELGRRIRGS